MMTREELEKSWALSAYNEGEEDQLDYYINERKCSVGDTAYLYDYADEDLTKMEIIHIICRSDDPDSYDELIEDEDVLLDGEDEYDASTSAEFITDNDCYLVWFKYVGEDEEEDV